MSVVIIYDSLLGKTEHFVKKLGFPYYKVQKGLKVDIPYILVTFTIGEGEIPETTKDFLDSFNNSKHLKGVVSSGHRNWGGLFGRAGDLISKEYSVPLIHKIEMRGKVADVEKVKEGAEKLCREI